MYSNFCTVQCLSQPPPEWIWEVTEKNTRQIEVREESFPWSVVSVVRNEGRRSERAACRLHSLQDCAVYCVPEDELMFHKSAVAIARVESVE